MAVSDKLKVSLLLLGEEPDPILDLLLSIRNIKLSIICPTFLDYEVPSTSDRRPVCIRYELIHALKKISSDYKTQFPIPTAIKETYMKELGDLVEEDEFGILYNINVIEEHTNNLEETFRSLQIQAGNSNVELLPLSMDDSDVVVVKGKKWSPLRHYAKEQKLSFDESSFAGDKSKLGGKSLKIVGLEEIDDDKIPETTVKSLQDADVFLISVSSLCSFAVFTHARHVISKIKKVAKVNRSVLLLPGELIHPSDGEMKLIKLLNYQENLEDLTTQIGEFIDYLLTDEEDDESLDLLRKAGSKILVEKLPHEYPFYSPDYRGVLLSIFSIGQSDAEPDFTSDVDGQVEESAEEDGEEPPTEESPTAMPISKLLESDEEKGIDKEMKSIKEVENEEEKRDEEDKIPEKKEPKEEELKVETKETNTSAPEKKVVEEENEEDKNEFDPDVSESWEEALRRAIQRYLNEGLEEAYKWIKAQCKRDPDLQTIVAEVLVARMLSAEGASKKIEIITLTKKLYETIRQSIIQVFKAYLLNSILEKDFDRRRELVYVFSLLQTEMMPLCEEIIANSVKDLTIKREDPLLLEMSKLTLVQLVIHSTRLKRIAVSNILTLLDARIESSPTYLWNFLLCFDAGSVAIELVTKFSISRSEELINRTPLLRYTGSFFTTLQQVMTYWKIGDQLSITNVTGSILPEKSLRKLERMDLATKIKKVKTVPLTTLAETLGKKPETIERMIAEMIMNDDFNVKLEVIDNRMIVIYSGDDD